MAVAMVSGRGLDQVGCCVVSCRGDGGGSARVWSYWVAMFAQCFYSGRDSPPSWWKSIDTKERTTIAYSDGLSMALPRETQWYAALVCNMSDGYERNGEDN